MSVPGLFAGLPFIVKVRAKAQQVPVMSPGPSSEVVEAGRSGSFCKWPHKLISDGCAWTGKAEITVPVKCVGQVRKLSPFHLNNNNDDSVSPCFCFIQSRVN